MEIEYRHQPETTPEAIVGEVFAGPAGALLMVMDTQDFQNFDDVQFIDLRTGITYYRDSSLVEGPPLSVKLVVG